MTTVQTSLGPEGAQTRRRVERWADAFSPPSQTPTPARLTSRWAFYHHAQHRQQEVVDCLRGETADEASERQHKHSGATVDEAADIQKQEGGVQRAPRQIGSSGGFMGVWSRRSL